MDGRRPHPGSGRSGGGGLSSWALHAPCSISATFMHWLGPDVVVLDPFDAVAADYCAHTPRRADFSLAQPYQASRLDADIDAAPSGPAGATPAAAAAATAQPPAEPEPELGAGTEQQRRCKRARASSYQPNEREQEAAQRHAAYLPQLAAAAAAVEAWVLASGAGTVQQALAAEGGQQQRQQQNGAAVTAGAAVAAAEAAAAEAAASLADEEEGPDYRAMFELRHALRPKLQLIGLAAPAPAGAAAAAASGEEGRPSCRPQDVQQPPACNLFNRLISSPSGGGSGSGSAPVEWAAEAGGHRVLLPPRSHFLMSDARQLQPLVEDAAGKPKGGSRGAALWEGCTVPACMRAWGSPPLMAPAPLPLCWRPS